MGAGSNLAHFAAAVRWSELPENVRAKTLDHVLDTVGMMFAGLEAAACADARKAAGAWGRGEESTVIGTEAMLPAPRTAHTRPVLGGLRYSFAVWSERFAGVTPDRIVTSSR